MDIVTKLGLEKSNPFFRIFLLTMFQNGDILYM